MDDELLSIVDENDQVIGQRSRREIHALGLRHRAVHVLIFDRSGRLFLQKRSTHKDRNPGLWDSSAAGHVDAGESYGRCVLREIREELGIDLISAPQPLFKLPASTQTGMEFCQVYRLIHGGPFQLNRDEIECGRWYNLEELDSRLKANSRQLTDSFKEIWRTFQARRTD
jgi:isopentenyl-diphosphate delta-isomerase type 1